jgi:hypothetical protein
VRAIWVPSARERAICLAWCAQARELPPRARASAASPRAVTDWGKRTAGSSTHSHADDRVVSLVKVDLGSGEREQALPDVSACVGVFAEVLVEGRSSAPR